MRALSAAARLGGGVMQAMRELDSLCGIAST